MQSNAYSAHQKTRTTSARLISHGHTDEAISILFEVAKELLKKGEVGSGVDLATAMLKAYDEKAEQVSDVSRGELVSGEREAELELTFLPSCSLLSFSFATPHLGRCTNLIALCPSNGNWRKTIIDGALKSVRFPPSSLRARAVLPFILTPLCPRSWSAKHGPSPAGDAALLYYIGELLYREKDFLRAEPHLISAGTRDAGRLLGEMGFEWSVRSSCSPSVPGSCRNSPFSFFRHLRSQSGAIDPSPYLLRLTLPFLLLSPPSIAPARTTLQIFLSLLLAANPSILLQRIPFPASKPGQPDDEILFTTLPVANWLQLVVRSVQRAGAPGGDGGKAAWTELVGPKYRSWGRPGLRDEHVREVSLRAAFPSAPRCRETLRSAA